MFHIVSMQVYNVFVNCGCGRFDQQGDLTCHSNFCTGQDVHSLSVSSTAFEVCK